MSKPAKPSSESIGPRHPISVVSARTGLSRDVLRVWERRYQAVEPTRTPGGQRVYSDEQIHRFQLLADATRHGRSIGSVADLSTAALKEIVADDEAVRHSSTPAASPDRSKVSEAIASSALAHALALDAPGLDRELRRAIALHGLPLFLQEIVPTLMHRIGDEWMAQRLSIPHEHLASAVVLTILLEALRNASEMPTAPRLLVATPVAEQHLVGAALIAASAALDGWSIVFLGANVPAEDLALAARGVQAVALSIVHALDPSLAVHEVSKLRAAIPGSVPIIVGGAAAMRLGSELEHAGAQLCADIAQARLLLARVSENRTASSGPLAPLRP